ncbi:cysteine proteinase [Exidia glandulosa HHB12029]|uniref:ubiquitinyl hydrolase 1 n=1 Tax=Exidia glandulosa HHB12029 TaxID=1314781 RepID=A0A165FSP2_EXIGL|nr:cysteine proteinase [Exidia glandulosa HHB12029]
MESNTQRSGEPAEQSQDTGLSGAKDPELAKLSRAQLLELNQKFLEETGLETRERALISQRLPMTVLRGEYDGAPTFVRRIDWLESKGYKTVRRSRGDGDCFYRCTSIAFAYVEKVLNAPDVALAVASALSTLEATLPLLKAAGFEPMVYEDFYEVFRSVIEQIVTPDAATGERLTPDILLEAFQEPQASNSIVVYLRLLTSAQIRAAEDDYSAFLFHPDTGEPMGVREFCESFVEAIGREADHVQITALARALKVNVRIAYLDGRGSGDAVEFVEFQNRIDGLESDSSGSNAVVLLYRPGHYDILET